MKYIPISLRIQVPETQEELLAILNYDRGDGLMKAVGRAVSKYGIKTAIKEAMNEEPVTEEQANRMMR